MENQLFWGKKAIFFFLYFNENIKIKKFNSIFNSSYNGFLPPGDRGRRRSKFVLFKRPVPNGVKRSKHYIVKTPHSSQAILNTKQHSISYTLSRTQAVIVEYTEDEGTDMFQVNLILFVFNIALYLYYYSIIYVNNIGWTFFRISY